VITIFNVFVFRKPTRRSQRIANILFADSTFEPKTSDSMYNLKSNESLLNEKNNSDVDENNSDSNVLNTGIYIFTTCLYTLYDFCFIGFCLF